MAMTLDNGAAVDFWGLVIRKLFLEKLRESQGVFGNLLCLKRFRKQVPHLVAKYRAATWLQNDYRRIRAQVRSQRREVAMQIRLGHIEETVVIERPAAA